MDIGTKIRNSRVDLDLTQKEVADYIGMNQSNYSKLERNVQEPSLEQLQKLCRLLRIDPRYLLGLEDCGFSTERDDELLSDIKALIRKYK